MLFIIKETSSKVVYSTRKVRSGHSRCPSSLGGLPSLGGVVYFLPSFLDGEIHVNDLIAVTRCFKMRTWLRSGALYKREISEVGPYLSNSRRRAWRARTSAVVAWERVSNAFKCPNAIFRLPWLPLSPPPLVSMLLIPAISNNRPALSNTLSTSALLAEVDHRFRT